MVTSHCIDKTQAHDACDLPLQQVQGETFLDSRGSDHEESTHLSPHGSFTPRIIAIETSSMTYEQHGDTHASKTAVLEYTNNATAGDSMFMSSAAQSRSLRTRNLKQSRLLYDLSYHPMDDRLHPSRAAKRRIVHGEMLATPDEASERQLESVNYNSDVILSETETKQHDDIPNRKGKKREQPEHCLFEPVRRSKRKKNGSAILYDSSVHPQDADLVASESEGDEREQEKEFDREVGKACSAMSTSSTYSEYAEADNSASETLPTSAISHRLTLPSQEHDWKDEPGMRRSSSEQGSSHHDEDPWPCAAGEPFSVWTECIEDQLNAEANAASPLNFEDDDKENNTNCSLSDSMVPLVDTMSIIPAVQYRASNRGMGSEPPERLVELALYGSFEHSPSPYGLGGIDGAQDDGQLREALFLLASSENLNLMRDENCGDSFTDDLQDSTAVTGDDRSFARTDKENDQDSVVGGSE